MDFEEWFEDYCKKNIGPASMGEYHLARDTWEYQQTIIDELQYLNGLQENHIAQLQAKLRAKYGSNSAE